MREIDNHIELVHALNAQTVTDASAVDTGDLDRQGAEAMEFVNNWGANGGDTLSSSNFFEVQVEHADDDGTGSPGAYEAVDATDVVIDTSQAAAQDPDSNGTVIVIDGASDDEASYKFAYIGDRRFVKVTINPNGTLTNGNPVSLDLAKARVDHRV